MFFSNLTHESIDFDFPCLAPVYTFFRPFILAEIDVYTRIFLRENEHCLTAVKRIYFL